MSSKKTKPNINPASFEKILPFFKREIKEDLEKMIKSLDENNHQALEGLLHKASGSSKTYGFYELADLFEKLKLELKSQLFTKHKEESLLLKIERMVDKI